MIPYGRQSLDEDDIAAVVRALRSDFLTTGPEVEAFENELAEYVGAKHVIAVNSGTAALHMAVAAAGIGPGDHVITSANTFLASANCAAYVGATPDFADIDPVSYNLSVESLQQSWCLNTKAVVAVDFAGQPCDYPGITQLAKSRGATIIQDASHSLGGSAFGHPVGGFPEVDLTTFSFHPVKTMTTGEGGAVATNRDDFAEFCREFRSHGMVRNPKKLRAFEPDPWVYEMQHLGFNYRITDLQCALGRSQLRRLDQFVKRRADIVARYNEAFKGLDHIQIPRVASYLKPAANCQLRTNSPNSNSSPSSLSRIPSPNQVSWHLYVVQIDFPALGTTRAEVMSQLREAGIGTQVHYIPVHLQPWYRESFGYTAGKCPNAEAYYERCVSLPVYPDMADRDIDIVTSGVDEALRRA